MDRVATARKAATTLLLRDGAGDRDRGGVEVLLLRRHARSGFAAGLWVFPGGAVDDTDRRAPAQAYAFGRWEERCRSLRVPADVVLGWHFAGVREAFEEAGVLAGVRGQEATRALAGVPPGPERDCGRESFTERLVASGLVADLDALVPFSRWVTPRASSRRFDTLFLAAAAPREQEPVPDGKETVEARWVRPPDALEECRSGSLAMAHPTVRTLEALTGAGSVAEVLARAGEAGSLKPVLPHMVLDEDRPSAILEPGDPGYPRDPFVQEFAEWA